MNLPFVYRSFTILLLSITLLTVNVSVAASLKILALGDSLTAGYGLEKGDAFPDQLEESLRSLGYEAKVINAGVSGDTTAGGLARLDWALFDQPKIVIIELGANDAMRGLDPEQVFKNLDAIITRLKKADCRVILAGMKAPRNLGPEYYNKFDQIYPDLADKHNILFYPFFLEGVATKQSLNQIDGIHPNAAGIALIVSGIQPLVINAMNELNVVVSSE